MIYTTGTIAGNGNTITGTGTNFTAAGSLIRVGCTLITFTNPVQVLQLTAITSGTVLSVTPAITPAIAAGTKYAILLSDSLSVDGLAQDIAETFGMYQKYMGGFSDVMNGTGDVTITINGQAVTVPGQKSVARKGANTDITSLGGLTTALSVGQGGTGGKTQAAARAGIGAVGVGDFGLGGRAVILSDAQLEQASSGSQFFVNGGGAFWATWGGGMKINYLDSQNLQIFVNAADGTLVGMSRTMSTGVKVSTIHYNDKNTTRAADGTLKSASPVVKIFADGRAENNGESEGVTVMRQGIGEYLIEGCMGLNADAAWGGIDGGFDVPKDRNRQPLVWLDYEVNPNGSVLVKTYHRTYPDAPTFAQNRIGYKNDDGSLTETVMNGDPVDIPADQFVSVRVEMPHDSIYNQAQEAAQKAWEEAARKATEEAQTDPDQPQS